MPDFQPHIVLGLPFVDAVRYALDVHSKQARKGTTIPYAGHLFGVASLVIDDGGDEAQVIAALLHDAMEDGGGTPRLEDIRMRFGERVARIVKACSDSDAEDPTQKDDWLIRKRKYLRHLHHLSEDSARVSISDKLHNARAILGDWRRDGDQLFDRFNGKKTGTLWYYACIVNALGSHRGSQLFQELERTVRELWRLAAPRGRWPASEEESPAEAPGTGT
jgi:(p)ppGpp synthase/HD superfamily hydrolase